MSSSNDVINVLNIWARKESWEKFLNYIVPSYSDVVNSDIFTATKSSLEHSCKHCYDHKGFPTGNEC